MLEPWSATIILYMKSLLPRSNMAAAAEASCDYGTSKMTGAPEAYQSHVILTDLMSYLHSCFHTRHSFAEPLGTHHAQDVYQATAYVS